MGRIHKDFALNLKFNAKNQFRGRRVAAPCQGEMLALLTCWSSHDYADSACRSQLLALQSCSRQAQAGGRFQKPTTNFHLIRLARDAGK
mmetsp:Transcript_13119/g.34186  ORF Transcript_13119/g.34186 Transcript_13119/m.34186 type:complete len:89 (-) Transcript_13119:278-544(-)